MLDSKSVIATVRTATVNITAQWCESGRLWFQCIDGGALPTWSGAWQPPIVFSSG
jgi:hypothetical protein